jgi:glycopeptide antibiotics resistance protein
MPVQFLSSVLFLAVFAVPVWAIFRIAAGIQKRRRLETFSLRNEIVFALFFLYVLFVLSLTVVPLPFSQARNPTAHDFNIVPIINTVKVFKASLGPRNSYMIPFLLENILGNVGLFFPLGIFLPIAFRHFRSLWRTVAGALLCSAAIEIIQYFEKFFGSYRSVDIDDVILNTIGAAVGFAFYKLVISRIVRHYSLV